MGGGGGNPIWRRGLDFAGRKDAGLNHSDESPGTSLNLTRHTRRGGSCTCFRKNRVCAAPAVQRAKRKRLAAIVVNSMAVSWGHVSSTEMHSSKVPEIFATLEFFREFRGVNLPSPSLSRSPYPWFPPTVDDAGGDQPVKRLLPGFRFSLLIEKYATCMFSYWSNDENPLRKYFLI